MFILESIKNWFSACVENLAKSVEWAFYLSIVALGLSFVVGIIGCVALCLYCKNRRKKRRELRAEQGRKLLFTLPDKRNTFLRDRLRSALKEPNTGEELQTPQEDGVEFSYVESMLEKALSSPLSLADRFSLEETAKLLKCLSLREDWSEKDLKTMNDCCLNALKIMAKYAV